MRILVLLLALAALSGCFGDDDTPGDDAGGDDGTGEDNDGSDDGGGTGDDAGGDDGTGGTGDGNETDDEPEPRDPVTWTISISGNRFVDGSITVQAGDTVKWVHEDGTTPHTVTSDDGEFHSGDCPGAACMTELSNAEFEHTFDDVGEFPYHCAVHPSMTGTITVQATFSGTPDA